MENFLHGLYGQINIPIVCGNALLHYPAHRFINVVDVPVYCNKYPFTITIANIPLAIGWTAIDKTGVHLDIYALGITPPATYHVGFNDFFSWGFGSDFWKSLLEHKRHRLSCFAQVNILSHKKPNLHNYVKWNVESQLGLTYAFKHFTSDLGFKCFTSNYSFLYHSNLYSFWDIGTQCIFILYNLGCSFEFFQ